MTCVSLKTRMFTGIVLVLLLSCFNMSAQISPGDLANAHSYLEGISNCTKCHVLGNKVSQEKCLACHTEIQGRLSVQEGYHVSSEVKGKDCTVCHSDHHGKNFQMIRMDEGKFDHSQTGYTLSVPHSKKQCSDCHNAKFITDQKIKTKKYTRLGLGTSCLGCHVDYHQKTLSSDCSTCHNSDVFKPASKFNHETTKFRLSGRHVTVDCSKCHKVENVAGKKFQDFRVAEYNCSSCHKDPHQNKFGLNCSQCHSEESFAVVKGVKGFDHNNTDYKLQDKHLTVNCKSCHKTKITDPLKFKLCTDCHTDYHKQQFASNGQSPDCSKCHSVKGFTLFSFTTDQHNISSFPLEGAHLAIPCTDCHRKQKEWSFKRIGNKCNDCHKDIHQNQINTRFYPDGDCKICHTMASWDDIKFDHSKTEFNLTGEHLKTNCKSCHLIKASDGTTQQKFSGLPVNCSLCHQDKHSGQIEKSGVTNCSECHDTDNWKASKFNHNSTAFKLDGKHVNVPCIKCHKPQQEGSFFFVRYKLKVFTCESCHS
jgi:predicted CXXCH cytochrome family protein